MKIYVHIAYDGSQYRGWQWQPNVMSVQQKLEDTLSKMLKHKVTCYGCGRTDAGVHASQYFFHLHIEQELDYDPVFRLNKMLPQSIRVYDWVAGNEKSSARFSAYERTYDYFLHHNEDAFLSNYSTQYAIQKLDVIKMQTAFDTLQKCNDFYVLCRTPEKHEHTRCKVTKTIIKVNADQTRMQISITANRFLKSMIRLLVARLLDVGAGALSIEEFNHCLLTKTPFLQLNIAPPQGLFLSKVNYPFLNLPNKSLLQDLLEV